MNGTPSRIGGFLLGRLLDTTRPAKSRNTASSEPSTAKCTGDRAPTAPFRPSMATSTAICPVGGSPIDGRWPRARDHSLWLVSRFRGNSVKKEFVTNAIGRRAQSAEQLWGSWVAHRSVLQQGTICSSPIYRHHPEPVRTDRRPRSQAGAEPAQPSHQTPDGSALVLEDQGIADPRAARRRPRGCASGGGRARVARIARRARAARCSTRPRRAGGPAVAVRLLSGFVRDERASAGDRADGRPSAIARAVLRRARPPQRRWTLARWKSLWSK
jgi:hypothetical protein